MIFACLFFMILGNSVNAAGVPGIDAKVTKKNIMTLLNKYDKDGAYLLNSTEKSNNYMSWFSKDERIINNLEVAIHEQCHHYTWSKSGSYKKISIYVGNKKKINVKFTKLFRTKKMAGSIPKRCRTFRYPTYISKPSKNLGSNIKGVYGLLDEFNAYCWGMHNAVSMYSYYMKNRSEYGIINDYIFLGLNGRQAYAEFKYYILHYLYYAKKHYPSVYKGIMSNKNFKKAYKKTEKRFAGLIKKYEKNLVDLGLDAYYDMTDEYKILCEELAKKRYVSLHKKLLR